MSERTLNYASPDSTARDTRGCVSLVLVSCLFITAVATQFLWLIAGSHPPAGSWGERILVLFFPMHFAFLIGLPIGLVTLVWFPVRVWRYRGAMPRLLSIAVIVWIFYLVQAVALVAQIIASLPGDGLH